ncbi:uncharacterized protein LOC135843366 [Planococcus citri]|uniref:uncharacterized protein LOC135843366 n=1 Tax=Planococcus citri TaxID=170843 RepID=UPI0031F85741
MHLQMNIINDDILLAILSRKNSDINSIRILDQHLEYNIVRPGSNSWSQVCRLIVLYQIQGKEDHIPSSPKKKTFFLKVPAKSPLYKVIEKLGSYDKEVEMYTKVVPQMYSIENNEYFTPRFYHLDDRISLVLKDLSKSGYKCADRINQLDFEHSSWALKYLAKFHALSVKLHKTIGLSESIKKNPFANLVEDADSTTPDDTSSAFTSQIPMFIDSLPQYLKDQFPHMVSELINLSSPESITKMAQDSANAKFKVLNHGDFWTNNIMFKYHEEKSTIKKVKLIDFQLTSWSSPVKDLIYFTLTSVKFEVYVEYFPQSLNIYLDTLNEVLGRLGCPIYDTESFMEDFQAMYPFALIVLCCVLPLFVSDPDDIIDAGQMCVGDKFQMSGLAKAYEQKYFQRISVKWFEHFARRGSMIGLDL